MIKWLFKWLFQLAALALVLVVIFLLTYNAILRSVVEHNIRTQTGMDAEIGKFSLGLVSPTLEIQNQKIYNPPSFGGTPFLDIPEIHVEYDRDALARREIHIKLLRFNLGELDIVKNQAGRTNIFMPGPRLPAGKSRGTNAQADFKKQSGYNFTGIDMLNVTIGTVKFIDLQNPQNNREQDIGIDDLVIPNVRTPIDLAGLGADIALHSNGFFDSMVGQKKQALDVLKLFGL